MNRRKLDWRRQLARRLPAGELRFDDTTREAHAGDKWFASHLP